MTIGEIIEDKQPNIHRALTCWVKQGAEAASQYRKAQRRIIGHLKFGALKRIMEERPKPGNAGILPEEQHIKIKAG